MQRGDAAAASKKSLHKGLIKKDISKWRRTYRDVIL